MRVLLVEDEEHKRRDLLVRLATVGVRETDLVVASGVREAVMQVFNAAYDLIVLDMALPTFSKAGANGGEGGEAQSVGGVEVLRALNATAKRCKIVIVTQYPDIVINGEKIRLSQMGKVISSRYNQDVIGAILYSYNDTRWSDEFDAVIGRMK